MAYWFYGSSTIKYHGLQNQGATCYLNSVLQVLYMTKDFRDAVKSHCSANASPPYIDVQLNTLFDGLKTRKEQTCDITRRLGIIDVYEQQDAAEYYEKILRMTSPEASQTFHGQLTHRITCTGCERTTDADSPFWSIPLAMPDPYKDYDVRDGFERFFQPATLSGDRDNQMFCDHCNSKKDATVAFKLKEQPEVLVLLLKRFDFNKQYRNFVKINSCVDIPETLHTPQAEKQAYVIYAIVDHYGDLYRGHYTARIKSLDDDDHGTWYRFDDARVREVDPHQIKAETQRSWSAYLLFYRKQQTQETNRPADQSSDDQPRPTSDHAEMANDNLRKIKCQEAVEDSVGDAKQSKTTHSVEHEVKPETPNEIQGAEERDPIKTGPVEKHQRMYCAANQVDAHIATDNLGGMEGVDIKKSDLEQSNTQGDTHRTSEESTVGGEQPGPVTPSQVSVAKTGEGGRTGGDESQQIDQCEPPSGCSEKHGTEDCGDKEELNSSSVDETMETEPWEAQADVIMNQDALTRQHEQVALSGCNISEYKFDVDQDNDISKGLEMTGRRMASVGYSRAESINKKQMLSKYDLCKHAGSQSPDVGHHNSETVVGHEQKCIFSTLAGCGPLPEQRADKGNNGEVSPKESKSHELRNTLETNSHAFSDSQCVLTDTERNKNGVDNKVLLNKETTHHEDNTEITTKYYIILKCPALPPTSGQGSSADTCVVSGTNMQGDHCDVNQTRRSDSSECLEDITQLMSSLSLEDGTAVESGASTQGVVHEGQT